MAATTVQPTWPELSAQIKPSLKLVQSPEFGVPRPRLYQELAELGLPGIESFNFMLHGGLTKAVKDIHPIEFALPSGTRIKLKLENAQIFLPQAPEGASDRNPNVYPKECRLSGTTYKGRLIVQVAWWLNGKMQIPLEKNLGDIPIMLKSDACHLANLTPEQMVAKGEHAEEFGGSFVVKGHERLLRLLTATRKNFPIAVQREKWKTRGKLFTDKGIMIRCVKPDMTSTNNVLHYLQNGTVKFMCSYQKALYFLPVVLILKALVNVTDEYIFQELILGMEDNLYFRERTAFMLRLLQGEGIHSYEQARAFIGKSFRIKFRELPEWYTDDEVCEHLLKKSVMIHLESNEDKFRAICFAIRKLFAFVQEHCVPEGMDPVMMQEVTLPGHTYLQLVKEKLEKFLGLLRFLIMKKAGGRRDYQLTQGELLWCLGKSSKFEASLETFLATGNLPSTADLGLMQTAGLTIVAENINRMRYMSHFKAIHRGAAFADSRSSEVRQLKPDAWGFLCPVHTPDGAPCGLLNHLTALCQVTNTPTDLTKLPAILGGLGMVSVGAEPPVPYKLCYPVQLEGKILGYIPDKIAPRLADKLRLMKVRGEKGVPTTLEIVLVPKLKGKVYGQYPGLYLFGGVARMVRPVINLAARAVELIGTFEQVYLDVAVTADEAIEGITTHQEICETSFLSNLACLIPFPDFNQSPRNMYQCQMGKQTMGTPCHNWPLQTESKLYRLQTPTTPLVRPGHWDKLGMDNFAMGTNAVVAVISYTGYDMEDAMVINRSSLQRGFAYGQVFKSEFVDLRDLSTGGVPRTAIFQRDPSNVELAKFVDLDGLPFPGTRLKSGDPFYCYYIKEEGKYVVEKYKHSEEVFIDNIKLCGLEINPEEIRRVSISYRVPRFPSVGDKFASRAGQKGICSQQWPAEDLPFTESGLIPDIVFNPHGFPSRMTIAMMIESMAGKGGAIHGMVHDATPFKFSEDDTAIDYYGRMLEAAGYNYYGTEKLYSGTDGREMNADIFFGIVHYQRLRHMVSDKFQVRSVGPVDIVTLQPIKGRKRGGGVRFGEMERDALLSHGTSFLLHDRLFHCSDKSSAYLCRTCGSILSPILELPEKLSAYSRELPRIPVCKICKENGDVQDIEVPHVFKFLIAQLASVNIKVSIKIASA